MLQLHEINSVFHLDANIMVIESNILAELKRLPANTFQLIVKILIK